jgi:hypothetical protein
MDSAEFAALARKNKADFTRERAMPLPDLVLSLLNFRKGTISSELRQFSKAMNGQDAPRLVSPSAFCQARKKLRHESLIALNDKAIEAFETHFAPHRWHGLRLLAVDGSTGALPNEEEVAETFGGPSDASLPMARFSRLYDVLNKLVIHADMAPYATGERELAASYLYATGTDDLTLYDRGYGAFWLFSMHRDLDRAYCARVKLSFSKEVKDFLASAEKSRVTVLRPSPRAKAQCEAYNLSTDPVPVRLIRVDLGKGQTEVLVTSLLDEKVYKTVWFKKLYQYRWGVEEDYKREKQRMEIENFSGKSAEILRQDLHAKVLALNLSAMMVWVAQAIADRVYEKRKRKYQINFANALSVLKNDLIRYISGASPWGMLVRLLSEIVESVEAVVPGRSYPRIKRKRHERTFHGNYKRTA